MRDRELSDGIGGFVKVADAPLTWLHYALRHPDRLTGMSAEDHASVLERIRIELLIRTRKL